MNTNIEMQYQATKQVALELEDVSVRMRSVIESITEQFNSNIGANGKAYKSANATDMQAEFKQFATSFEEFSTTVRNYSAGIEQAVNITQAVDQ